MLAGHGSGGTVRPFRFLVGARGLHDRRTLIEGARAAEAVGYSDLTIHDHLEPQLAPIPVLTAVAMATERLRLCPLVFNNDLRHPAVLAQDLATIDVISEGRLVVGIGAGWNQPEYASIGLPFDPPAIRISRMLEAVAILKGLFSDEPITFDGRYYTIDRLDGQPKPVQRPRPPFLIGGTRERLLRIAAREADIVGIDLAPGSRLAAGRLPRADGRADRLDPRGGRRALRGVRAERAPCARRHRGHTPPAEGGRRGRASPREPHGPRDRPAGRPRARRASPRGSS
jgi:probable F420-dependent oxidoreductase